MVDAHKCLSEEKQALLIRKIFGEEFRKQQKYILNIIGGNFELAIKNIKNLKKEISDLRETLEYTENIVRPKIRKREKHYGKHGKYPKKLGKQ